MKRILFVVLALLLLTACVGNTELESFVKDFNENSYEFTDVDILKKDSFGEIEKEKYGTWQSLFEWEDYYSIDAKYNDDQKLTGYYISISENQNYEELDGVGFEASQVIAETLGLDRDKFWDEFNNAIDNEESEYEDNGYKINISDFVLSDEHMGMTINFDKVSE